MKSVYKWRMCMFNRHTGGRALQKIFMKPSPVNATAQKPYHQYKLINWCIESSTPPKRKRLSTVEYWRKNILRRDVLLMSSSDISWHNNCNWEKSECIGWRCRRSMPTFCCLLKTRSPAWQPFCQLQKSLQKSMQKLSDAYPNAQKLLSQNWQTKLL